MQLHLPMLGFQGKEWYLNAMECNLVKSNLPPKCVGTQVGGLILAQEPMESKKVEKLRK